MVVVIVRKDVALDPVVVEVEQELAFRAADTLIEAHLTDDELGPAYQVAQLALSRHPDPERAIRYAPFIPENQANSRFQYDLGYRFEYDDNVTFPDDIFASGQEDYRHVLIADVLYERGHHQSILSCIDQMLADGGVALIVDPHRSVADGFEKLAREQSFDVSIEPTSVDFRDRGKIDGRMYRLTRKA